MRAHPPADSAVCGFRQRGDRWPRTASHPLIRKAAAMRKTLLVISPLVAVLAACSSSAAPSASSTTAATPASSAAAPSAAGGKVINVVEVQTKDSYTASGGPAEPHGMQGPPKGGDFLLYDATLSTNGAQVGTDEVTCTFGSDGHVQIEAHLTLADGTIVARGPCRSASSCPCRSCRALAPMRTAPAP
jgi:hypothetical protein